jgi:tetratricopeptide (TPR) repeat protein
MNCTHDVDEDICLPPFVGLTPTVFVYPSPELGYTQVFHEVGAARQASERWGAAARQASYGLGDLERARTSCEVKPDDWLSQQCLAVTYDKLGRHADAETVLAKLKTVAQGDAAAYQYATIYAQWGNAPKALEWLDTAMQLRDAGLVYVKTDPLLDPLRKEPRFQAIERELKFPN